MARGARPVVAGIMLPLVAGLALVGAVVWLAGPAATLATVRRIDLWQGLALVAAAFANTAFAAGALRIILGRYGHDVSAWLLFRLSVLAFAVGWLVPSGYVAGFPVAAWVLRRRGVPFGHGLASFVIERFLEMGAYALVLPVAMLSGIATGTTARIGLVAPLVAVVLLVLDLVLGWRLGRRGLARLATVAPRVFLPGLERGAQFFASVTSFFRSSPSRVLGAAALSAVATATSFLRAALTARFLHLPLGIPDVAFLVGFSLAILAVPFLPGGIGVYEGGMVGFFRILGRPATEGIAYAMVVHAVEFVVATAGVVFLVHFGVRLAAFSRGVPTRDASA